MSPDLLDSVLLQTDFPDLHLHASGKVRDIYSLGDQQLLFVATDRISAFDYILATGIPHKGRGAQPDFPVLVRLPRRHRPQSLNHRRRRPVPARRP